MPTQEVQYSSNTGAEGESIAESGVVHQGPFTGLDNEAHHSSSQY